MQKRLATWAILLLAFFGLADAAYLLQHEMTGSPLVCDPSVTLTGCNIVAQSPYAYLFGIPVAGYGLFFFGVLFLVVAFELLLYHHLIRRVIQSLALIGFAMSVYFVSIQLFVIDALCIYCLASAGTVLFIFLCAFLLEPVRKTAPLPHAIAEPPPPSPRLSMPPSA